MSVIADLVEEDTESAMASAEEQLEEEFQVFLKNYNHLEFIIKRKNCLVVIFSQLMENGFCWGVELLMPEKSAALVKGLWLCLWELWHSVINTTLCGVDNGMPQLPQVLWLMLDCCNDRRYDDRRSRDVGD